MQRKTVNFLVPYFLVESQHQHQIPLQMYPNFESAQMDFLQETRCKTVSRKNCNTIFVTCHHLIIQILNNKT